jgi:NAD(P)H dehydrogenase (quinone)
MNPMNKPRILVMTAAGKTGMPLSLKLLSEGFPVTAFVRQTDQRSDRLKAKGAKIVTGSITDIDDMKNAMAGVERAYFCTPLAEGNLKAASACRDESMVVKS